MRPYFILYTKKRCSYCRKAINLLNEKKEPYIITDLTKNKEIMQEIKEVFKHETVPIVLYADNDNTTLDLVGGYTELKELFENLEQVVVTEDSGWGKKGPLMMMFEFYSSVTNQIKIYEDLMVEKSRLNEETKEKEYYASSKTLDMLFSLARLATINEQILEYDHRISFKVH